MVQAECIGAQGEERERGRPGKAQWGCNSEETQGTQDGWNLKRYYFTGKKKKDKKEILLFLWTLVLVDGKMRWKVVFREEMEKELILEAAMGWKSQDRAWSELS